MRIEYLEYLLEVTRAGSITAAAKNLYIRQTTLSAIVSTIEDELNIKIFSRSRRGVKLTPEGEQALVLAQEIVKKNEELLTIFNAKRKARRTIQFVVTPGACNFLSVPLSMELKSQFSNVSLSIRETPVEKILSVMAESSAKIGVSADTTNQLDAMQTLGSGYKWEPLYTDHFYLAVGKSYSGQGPIDFEQLKNEHLAIAQFYPSINEMTVGNTLSKFQHYTRFSSHEQIKKAVVQSEMIAIMPGLALYDDIYLKQGLIRCLPILGFQTELVNFIIYDNKFGDLDDVEQTLLSNIRACYAKLPEPLFG